MKIDKQVPMPSIRSGYSHYNFGDMEVGDSLLVEGKDAMKMHSAASYYGTRNNKKFTIRAISDTLRCWRIK